MCNETTKASKRRKCDTLFVNNVFKGLGIDIGCGNDILKKEDGFPLIKAVQSFDLIDGNAQYINNFKPDESYDFVHSSQCLEHMVDPYVAIVNWFKLVKPGGYLVVTVPDEDLYEQGVFPSAWNSDHKWTFSIWKEFSWSNNHINMFDLIPCLGKNADIIKLSLIDTNYDYDLINSRPRVDQTFADKDVEAFIELVVRKRCNDWIYN
jgi:SAM-dependent methyltransferase